MLKENDMRKDFRRDKRTCKGRKAFIFNWRAWSRKNLSD